MAKLALRFREGTSDVRHGVGWNIGYRNGQGSPLYYFFLGGGIAGIGVICWGSES